MPAQSPRSPGGGYRAEYREKALLPGRRSLSATAMLGFVGLGAMGAPMLARLADAFPGRTLCHDCDAGRLDAVAGETGSEALPSLALIAARADILFTCLPDDAVVRQVYLGGDGIVPALRPGTITVDCSTIGPDATRDVNDGVAGAGGRHLDASMLGSVAQAREGSISFVVGGDPQALERVRPCLEACGGMIRHCGPSGSGNRMKLIHQTLVAGHAVAVAEALGLCLATGVDIDAFHEIVTGGTGFAHSRYFENRVPRIRAGNYDPLFMLKFMLKDARLARGLADPGIRAWPVLDAVIATLEQAADAGYGEADFSAAMKAVEARVGATADGGP